MGLSALRLGPSITLPLQQLDEFVPVKFGGVLLRQMRFALAALERQAHQRAQKKSLLGFDNVQALVHAGAAVVVAKGDSALKVLRAAHPDVAARGGPPAYIDCSGELGKRNPTVVVLEKIARALDIATCKLLEIKSN